MRVKNFMRELKMKATKWDENIVALAEKGSMSVEEFLKTDPITFGEKIWGKHDWKYTSGYSRLERILGESTHREMWGYYVNTPAQLAARAYEDAKFAARREQKALGLTTYMRVSAEDKTGWECVFAENKAAKAAAAAKAAKASLEAVNEAEKAAGVCQDGWHGAALEHANALFKLKEADTALAALRQNAAAEKIEVAVAAAAAVEADERYYAGRTFEQVVADEEEAAAAAEQAKLSKEAVEAVSAGLARQAAEDRAFAYQQVAAWEAMDAAEQAAPKEVEAEAEAQKAEAAAQKEWDERYAAAVEEDERYFAGRTFDQVVADEEEEAAEKRAAKAEEDEAHEMWMIERMCGATSLPCEEQTQLVAGVKEEVEADTTPLEAALQTYDKTNTVFEEVYERAKSGAGTWGDLDEAYSKLDAAAMNLAQEQNKPSVVVDITPIIQEAPADDSMAKEIEKGVETIEEFFMNYMSHSNLSLIELAKLRIKTANNALEEMFVTGKSAYMKSISGFSPEEQERLTEIRKLKFTTWRERAEKELVDLETQFAVSECKWECPMCTAVWKTG